MSTMSQSEQETLHKYIDSAEFYLEFGSGESTIYAAKSNRIKQIVSIESSQEFIEKNLKMDRHIQNALNSGRLVLMFVDIGETVEWGNPKNDEKKHLWPNYSLSPFCSKHKYDLCLVDGRFRIACTLNYILHSQDKSVIIIHDFWNRPEYHILLKYLEIIEKADSLGVFKAKKELDIIHMKKLIQKYQYLPKDNENQLKYVIKKKIQEFVL